MRAMEGLAIGLSLIAVSGCAKPFQKPASGSAQLPELSIDRLKLVRITSAVRNRGFVSRITTSSLTDGLSPVSGTISTERSFAPTTPATTTDGGDESSASE